MKKVILNSVSVVLILATSFTVTSCNLFGSNPKAPLEKDSINLEKDTLSDTISISEDTLINPEVTDSLNAEKPNLVPMNEVKTDEVKPSEEKK